MKRRALITGITGQDGSYMAEFLLEQGYEVYGLVRRTSTTNHWRIEGIQNKLNLISGDLGDLTSLETAVRLADPHEVYNFAAQTFVGASFQLPLITADITGLGFHRLLEAVRTRGSRGTKVYQASSSEQYGNCPPPQSETTPFNPISPYGCAKAYAHTIAETYREAYDMFIVCGISFNHESERRGEEFVTRKITLGIADILRDRTRQLQLGNLDAKRDWCHAEDIVRGAWLGMQYHTPHDYVFASGQSHTVKEFCQLAFECVDLSWKNHVVVNEGLFRPTDIAELRGNFQWANQMLGWDPSISFGKLVKRMVAHDTADIKPRHSLRTE